MKTFLLRSVAIFSICTIPASGVVVGNVSELVTAVNNANAGGDNVHRGMVLGLLVGAANDEPPEHLIKGLLACDELKNEIEAFADIVLSGQGI